jgi:hypothetical protein
VRKGPFVKGRVTQHLLRQSELDQLKNSPLQQEIVVWIRNIDQWNDDIGTALNGLLEDGYIDLETESGEVERFYKPEHLRFVSEMAADSGQDFSSPFFNRWVRIGVSAEDVVKKDKTTSFEKVLNGLYEFDEREAFLMSVLFEKVMEIEKGRKWQSQTDYELSPESFYIVAEAVPKVKQTHPEWIGLQEEIARAGYDPRIRKPANDAEKAIQEKYLELSDRIVMQQILLLLAQRFRPSMMYVMSDRMKFISIVKSVFGKDALPDFTEKMPAVDQMKLDPSQRLFYNEKTMKVLSAMERGRQISRGVVVMGETGAAKTTAAAHFAAIHGMKFYKYQSHRGSETSDLTVEYVQDEAGNLQ